MDEKAQMMKMVMKAVAIAMVPLTSWMNSGDVTAVTAVMARTAALAARPYSAPQYTAGKHV